MNPARLLFVLACLAGLAALPGCSQGPWARLNPWQQSSESPGDSPVSGIAGLGGAKPDPKAPKNPFALARLSERQGQTGKAEQLYQEILKKSPNHAGAHHRLGVMYARQGKMPQAEEHFARALALKPDSAELLSDAGYFYYLTGRAPEAERCLRRALELEPANRKYCTNLALAVAEQGRRDEAYALFRRAGSEKEAAANMAFVLAQQGEYQQALNLYDRVLTEDPTMRVAADAMIELSRRLEQKGQVAPSPMAKDAGPVQAAHAAAAAPDEAAALRASALVTVSEGRPVPPPWAANRDPAAGPPSSPPAALQAGPRDVGSASFTAEKAADSTGSPAERRFAAGTNPGIAAGVPCAYVAPADHGSTPRRAAPAGTQAAEAKTPCVGPPFAGTTGAPETPSANRPAFMAWLDQGFFQLSTLALFLGVTLMGTGAVAWLRRDWRPRADAESLARRPYGRRAGPTARCSRRAAPVAMRRARA